MKISTRLALGILGSAALVAGCAGGGTGGHGTASVIPQTVKSTAGVQAQGHHWSRQDRPRVVAFLNASIEASGNATFAIARHDWRHLVFESSSAVSAPIPAFALACRHCFRHGDHDGDADDRSLNYYVEVVTLPSWGRWHDDARMRNDNDRDADDGTVVAGPGNATKREIDFPAANAPMALVAKTRYLFELVRTTRALATPTPPPPPPRIVQCPTYTNASAISIPATIPAPVAGSAGVVSTVPLKIQGSATQFSCGISGKMYFALTQAGTTATYTFDPITRATALWSSVGAPDITIGGDGLIYEQGTFGSNTSPQIAQFSIDGTKQTFVPGGVPGTLLTGPDGNVYTLIANGVSYSFEQLRTDGTTSSFPLPAGCTVDAVASGPGSSLWIHSQRCGIMSMSTSGVFAKKGLLIGGVSRMAEGPDGALYASSPMRHAIVRIDPATGLNSSWLLPSNLTPGGLVRASGTMMWFDAHDTSTNNATIVGINLLTGAMETFDQGAVTPSGFYMQGPDGNIYSFASNGTTSSAIRINGTMTF